MLWALLFSIIFGNNEPVFIIPKLDKHVKKTIVDSARENDLLDQINRSKKHRKKNNKIKKGFRKDFRKLNTKNTSTSQDFQNLLETMTLQKKMYQKQEIDYVLKAKKMIFHDEWVKIIKISEKDINKEIKRVNKEINNLDKKYTKCYKLIRSRIKHLDTKRDAIEIFENTYTIHFTYLSEYKALLEDKNSIIFRYQITEDEINFEVNKINALYFEIFSSIVEGHQKLAVKIQDQDWRKINKQTPDF